MIIAFKKVPGLIAHRPYNTEFILIFDIKLLRSVLAIYTMLEMSVQVHKHLLECLLLQHYWVLMPQSLQCHLSISCCFPFPSISSWEIKSRPETDLVSRMNDWCTQSAFSTKISAQAWTCEPIRCRARNINFHCPANWEPHFTLTLKSDGRHFCRMHQSQWSLDYEFSMNDALTVKRFDQYHFPFWFWARQSKGRRKCGVLFVLESKCVAQSIRRFSFLPNLPSWKCLTINDCAIILVGIRWSDVTNACIRWTFSSFRLEYWRILFFLIVFGRLTPRLKPQKPLEYSWTNHCIFTIFNHSQVSIASFCGRLSHPNTKFYVCSLIYFFDEIDAHTSFTETNVTKLAVHKMNATTWYVWLKIVDRSFLTQWLATQTIEFSEDGYPLVRVISKYSLIWNVELSSVLEACAVLAIISSILHKAC